VNLKGNGKYKTRNKNRTPREITDHRNFLTVIAGISFYILKLCTSRTFLNLWNRHELRLKIIKAFFKQIIEEYWIENDDFAFYSRSAFVIASFLPARVCISAQRSVVAPCGAPKRIEPSSSLFYWQLCPTYAFSFAYKRARLDIESISFFSGVVLCRSFQFFPLFKNCPKQFHPRAACPKRCCRNFWKILTFSNLTKKNHAGPLLRARHERLDEP